MAYKTLIVPFVLYRLSSVFIVQTSFVADEYWQSLEVAHNLVFGYGYLTWEWRHGLRSYLYPTIFAGLYKIIALLGADSATTLTVLPRILQASITALSDCYFVLWCKNLGCNLFWTKVALYTNWFWYFCGSRTIVNTFEVSLTVIALYYYPWSLTEPRSKKEQVPWSVVRGLTKKYLTVAAITCFIRPTAFTIWGPLVLYQLILVHPKFSRQLFLQTILPISLVVLSGCVTVDSLLYQKLVITPVNFLVSNVVHDMASFYGAHPAHWYASQGIPVVLGLLVVPFLLQAYSLLFGDTRKLDFVKPQRVLLFVILFNVMVYSAIPHKEFRFMLPLLPMMSVIAVKGLSLSQTVFGNTVVKRVGLVLLALGFVVPTVLFGMIHQRGTLSAIKFLSGEASRQPGSSLLFLMPCHSTPLYSHLHVNISARFLRCDPPVDSAVDESDEFYSDPEAWLKSYWAAQRDPPSHVVCFDVLVPNAHAFLLREGFTERRSFDHTILPEGRVGRTVVVYIAHGYRS